MAQKNHRGGFGTKCQSNKVVTIYANPDSEPRCVVYLLDFYFSKFPKPPESMDCFYLPKAPTSNEAPWFEPNPIGKNTLGKFVEKMCKEAGIAGKKNNHSLRATGASAVFCSSTRKTY